PEEHFVGRNKYRLNLRSVRNAWCKKSDVIAPIIPTERNESLIFIFYPPVVPTERSINYTLQVNRSIERFCI
ncbi:MAG: hypothetical protein ABI402_19985, partial [Ferruginibacter sp.]